MLYEVITDLEGTSTVGPSPFFDLQTEHPTSFSPERIPSSKWISTSASFDSGAAP